MHMYCTITFHCQWFWKIAIDFAVIAYHNCHLCHMRLVMHVTSLQIAHCTISITHIYLYWLLTTLPPPSNSLVHHCLPHLCCCCSCARWQRWSPMTVMMMTPLATSAQSHGTHDMHAHIHIYIYLNTNILHMYMRIVVHPNYIFPPEFALHQKNWWNILVFVLNNCNSQQLLLRHRQNGALPRWNPKHFTNTLDDTDGNPKNL